MHVIRLQGDREDVEVRGKGGGGEKEKVEEGREERGRGGRGGGSGASGWLDMAYTWVSVVISNSGKSVHRTFCLLQKLSALSIPAPPHCL